MKIQTTDTINEHRLKIVLSGISGSGKTFQAKTLTKNYKPIIASMESGLMCLTDSSIPYVDLTKDDKGDTIPKHLRINRVMEFYKYVLTDECKAKYDTLFIDSLTEIGQCLFDALRLKYPDNKDNLLVYGELGIKQKDLIKAFRDIPHYNVVITCLSNIEKDDTGKRYTEFDIIGKTAKQLPGFMDLVLYIRINADGTREFVCNGTDSVVAKDRSSKLDKLEPANLGSIFDKILKKEEVNVNA